MSIRVLIVKTSSMGDLLHTLPALTEAMNAVPGIRFDWVTEEAFAEIPTWHPAVDRVIPVAIRRWRKQWFSRAVRKERQQFIQQLQAQSYDLVIDAQGLIKSALITRKAQGIKHGYDRHSIKEPLASLFYDIKHRVAKDQHAVERIRALFALSLDYSFDPSIAGDYGIAAHFQQERAPSQSPSLVFLHATTRDEKHWPEHAWRELIERVVAEGFQVKLPWGTVAEKARAERLATDLSKVTVLPKSSLSQIASELAQASAVVSVDTGLSHLTAALDQPNLTLYGPTDPALIGGYGRHQHVLRSADHVMASITPDEVFTQLLTLL